MPNVTFWPSGRVVRVRPGTTLLEASRSARVHVRTRCNGMASCLMCKVEVAPDQALALQPPGTAEQSKIGDLLPVGIRLSCQARVRANVAVTVPEDPLKAIVRKQLEQQQREREERW